MSYAGSLVLIGPDGVVRVEFLPPFDPLLLTAEYLKTRAVISAGLLPSESQQSAPLWSAIVRLRNLCLERLNRHLLGGSGSMSRIRSLHCACNVKREADDSREIRHRDRARTALIVSLSGE